MQAFQTAMNSPRSPLELADIHTGTPHNLQANKVTDCVLWRLSYCRWVPANPGVNALPEMLNAMNANRQDTMPGYVTPILEQAPAESLNFMN